MKRYLNSPSFYGFGVVMLLIIRGFLNAVLPLMDKTEARYAEIARIMVETGNWVTPQIDYDIPFWAKPPLSTWLSALCIKVFGVNEFVVRLPYLLLVIMLVFFVGKYAKRAYLPFFLPGCVLLTIPEFIIHAGVVSTDTVLAFSVTMVMLSFWEAIQENAKKYWKYLIFVGLGIGLLAKGPIVGILTLPPIVIWILVYRNHKEVFKKIALVSGILIMLLIGFPWYLIAELYSPGFIDYFIVGEHFKRFFDATWVGDKYGFPKSQPYGIIWVFLLLFTIPWGGVLILKFWQKRKEVLKNKWVTFLLLWFLWTPIFFTISKSLIHPYIMPAMVPLALLITNWWKNISFSKNILQIGYLVPIIALFACLYGLVTKQLPYYMNTDKYFIEKSSSYDTVYHLNYKSYSGQFYTRGKMKVIGLKKIGLLSSSNKKALIIIPDKDFIKIPQNVISKLQKVNSNYKKSAYIFKDEFLFSK